MPKCSEDLWTPCIVVQKERERPQVIGEAVWAWTIAPLFVLIFRLLVVLASSTCGNQHFFLSLRCADCYPIRIRDERKRLVATSPVITKRRGPSWGGTITRRTASWNRRDVTQELSAQPVYVRRKDTAPLSATEEQTARAIGAYAQCACSLALQMGSIN